MFTGNFTKTVYDKKMAFYDKNGTWSLWVLDYF